MERAPRGLAQAAGGSMSADYSLALTSSSTQPGLNFGVYAVPPVKTEQSDPSAKIVIVRSGACPLVWLSAPAGAGAQCHFSWVLEWSFLYAEQGCEVGSRWSPNARVVSVDPGNKYTNTAYLDYSQGAYSLSLVYGAQVDPSKLYLATSPTVPAWSPHAGPSVGLAVKAAVDDGTAVPVPVIAVDSGPNLLHTFGLNLACRVHLSSDDQGTMTDRDAVQDYHLVEFGSGHAAKCTLQVGNIWDCGAAQG
jgi:hypothetical protein